MTTFRPSAGAVPQLCPGRVCARPCSASLVSQARTANGNDMDHLCYNQVADYSKGLIMNITNFLKSAKMFEDVIYVKLLIKLEDDNTKCHICLNK